MAGPHRESFAQMLRRRSALPPFLLALLLVTVPAPAGTAEQNWLPPGSAIGVTGAPPAELIRAGTIRDERWLYGRLLFHSPALLGERAVRIGLSCNGCHTNGHRNSSFFIEGLSDRPGRIDVTHRFWKAGSDDGLDNPIDIPSLRGVRDGGPYGTTLQLPDLAAFTRHVIVTEFAGPPPDDADIEALLAYINSLAGPEAAGGVENSPPLDGISYLPLLAAPIAAEDFHAIDRRYDLILSDYGRHAAAGDIAPSDIERDLARLAALYEKAAAGNFAAASLIHQSLSGGQ